MSLDGRVPRINLILAGQMQLRLDFLDKFLRSRSQLDRQNHHWDSFSAPKKRERVLPAQ